MKKVKATLVLSAIFLLVWGGLTAVAYTLTYLCNFWLKPPTPPTWRGAVTQSFPDVFGLFIGTILFTYWQRRKLDKQRIKQE